MAVSDWLRPPRHLVVLFLGIALVLVSTLAWLGWRLFQQDRALEEQRVQVRLEHAADVVAAELTSTLRSIEDELAGLAALPASELTDSAEQFAAQFSDDAVVLVVSDEELAAYPSERLLYYPVTTTGPEPDPRVFARGEGLEFRQQDLAAAARVYRAVAQSSDSAVRAGALLRLGRTEKKAKRFDEALNAYDELANLEGTQVVGLPSALVARHARLSVLEGLSRAGDLGREADALRADLQTGRWRLTRAQYELYSTEVCRWTDCVRSVGTTATSARDALTGGAEWLWNRLSAIDGDGYELTRLEGHPALVVWHHSTDRTTALVGGATHLAEDWIGSVESVLSDLNIEVALSDVTGRDLTDPVGSGQQLAVTRSMAETRLPWTLRVTSADPLADFAQLGERRRLMQFGLATLALFVMVGLYAVMRGVSRELEVARLQSDFVAAVSHEFRTPLTSLRQLAELLSSGRVASDERRAQYYGIMERESGRLHRLVEGLLDFGRMEAGALEFRHQRVTPSDLVQDVVSDFEAELGESGYNVELNADGATSAVRADSEALGRAVWNLLDNAIKYSPEAKTVQVRVSQDAGRVAIAVCDKGVGIPAAEQDTIFEKFIRGTSSDGRGTKGTGIGLAMVKHIVEAHRGEVRVESQVGLGSTFTILLPVEE